MTSKHLATVCPILSLSVYVKQCDQVLPVWQVYVVHFALLHEKSIQRERGKSVLAVLFGTWKSEKASLEVFRCYQLTVIFNSLEGNTVICKYM